LIYEEKNKVILLGVTKMCFRSWSKITYEKLLTLHLNHCAKFASMNM